MKRRLFRARVMAWIMLVLSAPGLLVTPAMAATQYWDSNGATAGAGTTPTGTWGTDNFWSSDSSGSNTTGAWTGGNDAVFSAGVDATGSPTITINGTQNATSITIQEGTLTFSGGAALEIGAGGLTLSSGIGATTISTPITLVAGQTWTHNDDSLLTVQTGAFSLGANQLTLAIGSAGGITISSAIGGTGGSIVKSGAGAGTLTLSGANGYTGGVTHNTGIIVLGNDAALGASGSSVLTWNGGELQASAARVIANAVTMGGNVTVSGSQALTLTGNMGLGSATRTFNIINSAATTFAGIISSGGLTKTGTGALTLTGNSSTGNSYTGGTTVNLGTLTVDFSNATYVAPASDVINSGSALTVYGGTLQITGKSATANSQTFNGLTVSGGGTITGTSGASGGSLNIVLDAISRSAPGTITFNKPSSGNITTTTANTGGILGPWASYAGTDYARNDESGPPGNIVALNAAANNTQTTWDTTGVDNLYITAVNTLTAARSVNTLRTAVNGTLSLGASGQYDFTANGILSGTSTLTISRSGTSTASLVIGSSGELVIGGSGNITIQVPIIGTGDLIKAGAGTLTLNTNAANFNGTTYVTGGTMSLGIASALGTSNPTVMSGGTLTAAVADALSGRTVTINEGGILYSGIADGLNNATVNVNAYGTVSAGGANYLAGATVALAGGTLYPAFGWMGGSLTLGGTIQVADNSKADFNNTYRGIAQTAIFGALSFTGANKTLEVTAPYGPTSTQADAVQFSSLALGANNGEIKATSAHVKMGAFTGDSGTTLTKTGNWVLYLNGAATWTGAGGVIANAGTTYYNFADSLGTTTGNQINDTAVGGATVANAIRGATVQVNAGGTLQTPQLADVLKDGTVVLNGGTLRADNGWTGANIKGAVQVSGNSTVNIYNNSGYGAQYVIFGGLSFTAADKTLEFVQGGNTGVDYAQFSSLTLGANNSQIKTTSAHAVVGAFTGDSGTTLTKTGTWVLYLNGAATWTGAGGVIANAGTTYYNFADSLGTTTGNQINNTAVGTANVANAIRGATVQVNSGGTLNAAYNVANTLEGSIVVLNGGTLTSSFHWLGGAGARLNVGGTIQVSDNSTITVTDVYTVDQGAQFGDLSFTSPNKTLRFNSGNASTTYAQFTNLAVNASTLQITAPVNVTISGPTTGTGLVATGSGTLTLTPSTPNTFSTLTVGDGTTFSGNGVGGSVSATTVNALGAGTVAVTVNYGGTLTLGNVNYANTMTVNAGGSINLGGNSNTGANITVNSMGTIGTGSTAFGGTIPSKGVLIVNAATTATAPPASFTGNMAFCGIGALTIDGASAMTLGGADRTLAFDATAVTTFTDGLALNANLTVAGSGNTGLGGMVPLSGAGNLGTVTQDATDRSIAVTMAPTAAVQLAQTATGYKGGLTVNSGTVMLTGMTTGTKHFGGGTVTLNGGAIRFYGSTATVTDSLAVGPNGGTIESYLSGGSGSTNTFDPGTAMASAAGGVVTLRAVDGLVLVGSKFDFSSYGAVVETTTARIVDGVVYYSGAVQFNTALPTLGTQKITVRAGSMVGFDATVWSALADFSKFTFPSNESLVALNNKTASSGTLIDLRSTGMNADVSLSSSSVTALALPAAGTIYPYDGQSIRIVPNPGGISSANADQFGGASGAYSLLVSAGAGSKDNAIARNVFQGTLTVSAAQSYTGTTTVRGTVKNALMGGGVSGATLTLTNGTGIQGELNNTSSITLTRGSRLYVAGTAANYGRITKASVPITVMGGATFYDGDDTNNAEANNSGVVNRIGYRFAGTTANGSPVVTDIADTSSLVVGASIVGNFIPSGTQILSIDSGTQITLTQNATGVAGTLSMGNSTLTMGGTDGGGTFYLCPSQNGNTHAQTFAKLNVGTGINFVTLDTGSAYGTQNLIYNGYNGGGYTRTVGGIVKHTVNALTTQFSPSFNVAPTTAGGSAVSGTGNNALLIGALRMALNDVAEGSMGFIKATSGALVEPDYQTQSDPTQWTAGNNIKTGAAVGSGAINSLAINSLLWTTGAGTLNINANQTLTINSGMLLYCPNAGAAITGGNLSTGNGVDLIVGSLQHNLTINSKITGNYVLSNILGGIVTLTNSANEIGDIYALAGTISGTTNVGALGQTGTTRVIYLYGGTVSYPNLADQTYSNTSLVVSPAGGTYSDGGTAAVSSLGGTITLNGNLNVTGTGDKTLSNAIGTALGVVGGGQGTITAQTNAGRLTLSGNNQYWTGGLRVGDGMQVRLNSANAAGSGPIVNHSAIGILEFTGNTDGARTVSNDIVGSASTSKTLISSAKTDAAVTLTGRIYSVGGLTFQGYDSGSGVSETVLSGSVSLSGVPDIYNFAGPASGNATSFQQFINAQGGINLGVTKYRGTTATELSYGTAGFLAYAAGTTTAVANGAEGYVRFSGAQSLIPGAVGPGYIAAIRKSGTTGKNFGYLLTGTSGAGTTYTLPEGKSFVIGSLGSGTQVGGTFGAAGGGVATFLGSGKLSGAEAGDINIHANAVSDVQTNSFLVRATNDVLKVGNGANHVVISPTYGDSGVSSAITLMRDRTGATTLNKIGEGTLELINVGYSNVAYSASMRDKFAWNVNAGTLKYSQVDSGAAFASFVVNSNATLSGTGTVNAAVLINDRGIHAPGDGVGTNTIVGSLTMATNTILNLEFNGAGGTDCDLVKVVGYFTNGDANAIHYLTATGTIDSVSTVYTCLQWTAGTDISSYGVQSNWKVTGETNAPVLIQWVGGASGNWTDSAKWDGSGGSVSAVDDGGGAGHLAVTFSGVGTRTPGLVNDVLIDPTAGGITVTAPGSAVYINSLQLGGVNNQSPTLTFSGGGPFYVTRTVDVRNGTLTATAAALNATRLVISGGTVTIGTGVITEDVTVSGGSLTVNTSLTAASLNANGGTISLSGTATIPTISVAGGTLNLNGALGTATVSLSVSSGALNFNPTATGTIGGISTFTGGTTTLNAAGITITRADVSSNATFLQQDGAITTLNLLAGSSTVTVTGGTIGTANVADDIALNGGTTTTLNVSAGALSLGGATVTTANLTGGTVTATVGSIGTLTLGSGVTAATGLNLIPIGSATVNASGIVGNGSGNPLAIGDATAMTALTVNGAYVSRAGNVTTLTVNGGTNILTSGWIGTATVNGGGLTANGGAIAIFNQAGGTGTSTIGASASVTNATVASGTVNFNNTSVMTNLTVTGGTANIGAGVKADVANFSAGTGTVNAYANALTVTNKLLLVNSVTATISNAPSFAVSGSNIVVDAAATPRTVTLSGGTLVFLSALSLPSVMSSAELWFDANTLSTITKDGNNKVSQWNSRADGTYAGAYAVARYVNNFNYQNGTDALYNGTGGPSSLPAIQLTNNNFFNFKAAGGANLNLTDIRSVFWVVSGAGWLLGDNESVQPGGTGTYLHFHRGGNGYGQNASDPLLLGPPNFGSSALAAAMAWRMGTSSMVSVDPRAWASNLSSGYQIVDTISSSTAYSAGSIALGNYQMVRTGSQNVCEVVIFNTTLNDTDRDAVETYLKTKWVNGGGASGEKALDFTNTTVAATASSTLSLGGTSTTNTLAGLNLSAGATLSVTNSLQLNISNLVVNATDASYGKVEFLGTGATVSNVVGGILTLSGTPTEKTMTIVTANGPVLGTFANENGQVVTAGNIKYEIKYNQAGNNVVLERMSGSGTVILFR